MGPRRLAWPLAILAAVRRVTALFQVNLSDAHAQREGDYKNHSSPAQYVTNVQYPRGDAKQAANHQEARARINMGDCELTRLRPRA